MIAAAAKVTCPDCGGAGIILCWACCEGTVVDHDGNCTLCAECDGCGEWSCPTCLNYGVIEAEKLEEPS